jgi:hypothetical protein
VGESKNLTKKALVIACSSRKALDKHPLPAIERYDGVAYRTIRKLQREGRFPEEVDIKILSARLGLIDALTPIVYYDQRMNKHRANELRNKVQEELTRTNYDEIYIDLGKDYLPVIEEFINYTSKRIILAHGRIGERLKNLKEWLLSQRG